MDLTNICDVSSVLYLERLSFHLCVHRASLLKQILQFENCSSQLGNPIAESSYVHHNYGCWTLNFHSALIQLLSLVDTGVSATVTHWEDPLLNGPSTKTCEEMAQLLKVPMVCYCR